MQFTTLALTALLSLASAQTVHVVSVSSKNNSLVYSPDRLSVPVGDMVQFQFQAGNHTITQSTFDAPCQPIAMHSNVTGVYSGFQPVSASAAMAQAPLYTIMVANKTPIWLYCSQGKHCQAGMVMVINENTAANATRSLENFKALAKQATVNLPGGATTGGTSSGGSTGTGSTGSTGSGSGTTTGTGSSATSTDSANSPAATAGASSMAISGSLSLAGLAAALLML